MHDVRDANEGQLPGAQQPCSSQASSRREYRSSAGCPAVQECGLARPLGKQTQAPESAERRCTRTALPHKQNSTFPCRLESFFTSLTTASGSCGIVPKRRTSPERPVSAMATDIESFVNVQPNICIVIRHDEYIFYRPKRRQAMVRSRSDTARRNGHIIWLFAGADTGAET